MYNMKGYITRMYVAGVNLLRRNRSTNLNSMDECIASNYAVYAIDVVFIELYRRIKALTITNDSNSILLISSRGIILRNRVRILRGKKYVHYEPAFDDG